MAGLQADLDRSAEMTSKYLDKVWIDLFRIKNRMVRLPNGEAAPMFEKRKPRTWQERNEDIYARLGFVPERAPHHV